MSRKTHRLALVAAFVLGGHLPGCPFQPLDIPALCAPETSFVPTLQITPGEHRNLWLQSENVTVRALLSSTDCQSLEGAQVLAAPSWADVVFGEPADLSVREVNVTLRVSDIPEGIVFNSEILIGLAESGAEPAVMRLQVMRVVLQDAHVGVDEFGCAREGETRCDHWGLFGIGDTVADVRFQANTRIHVYDAGGDAAVYEGDLYLGPNTWLSAAPGVSRDNVVIMSSGGVGVFVLELDHVRIQDVTAVLVSGTDSVVQARPLSDSGIWASEYHHIENVVAQARYPEYFGANGIQSALRLGSHTTVLNSHFDGFFESELAVDDTTGIRLLGNTFVYFGHWDPVTSLEGTRDFVFANNVVLSLGAANTSLFRMGEDTAGAIVTDNLVEGFYQLVAGAVGPEAPAVISGNVVGEFEAESPLRPRPLTGSTQVWDNTTVPREGVSLDGVDFSDALEQYPGAYQVESELRGPRMRTVTVGPSGCDDCTLSATDPQVMQQAAWTVWPGGRIEVLPNAEPYSGNMVLTWGVDVVGMGARPEEVVLNGRDDPAFNYGVGIWSLLTAVIHVPRGALQPVSLDNLTIRPVVFEPGSNRGVLFETAGLENDRSASTQGTNYLTRLRIEIEGDSDGDAAMVLGDNTVVRDVLVYGRFQTCVRLGPRLNASNELPASTVVVTNFTCRLTNVNDETNAFTISSAVDSLFANIAVSFEPTAFTRIFSVERVVGVTDVGPLPRSQPQNLRSAAITAHGAGELWRNVEPSAITLEQDIVLLADTEALFTNVTCEPLQLDCGRLDAAQADNGVDPTTLSSEAILGTSINGVDRATAGNVDRGAYEQ